MKITPWIDLEEFYISSFWSFVIGPIVGPQMSPKVDRPRHLLTLIWRQNLNYQANDVPTISSFTAKISPQVLAAPRTTKSAK
jgi:hypothetical protein